MEYRNLSERYCNLLQSIDKSAKDIFRQPENITLIAVSKTFHAEDIQALYNLGQRHFGENYIQEWIDKKFRLPENIVWHVIGDIQSNKTKDVAENADWVHTLSRLKIAQRLSNQRPANLPPLNVCVEINISKEPQKHGIFIEDAKHFMQEIMTLSNLKLRGMMCVPSNKNIQETEQQMQMISACFNELKQQFQLDTLSMGMSGDWKLAIKYGATHIRVGYALFGARSYPAT